MEYNFNLVSNLPNPSKTVFLSAGIAIALLSCVDDHYTVKAFVKGGVSESVVATSLPSISANVKISLTSNLTSKEGENTLVADGGDRDVLGNFVSSILRNTKSLDSDISKLVDDNFWDLV